MFRRRLCSYPLNVCSHYRAFIETLLAVYWVRLPLLHFGQCLNIVVLHDNELFIHTYMMYKDRWQHTCTPDMG